MIQKGLIVSCQAEANSAFNNPHSIVNFAKEAERGGAVGVRIKGINNIPIYGHLFDMLQANVVFVILLYPMVKGELVQHYTNFLEEKQGH